MPEYDPDMPLHALYRYRPEIGGKTGRYSGVLSIEEPCVYIDRLLLALPEFFTRYDPDTAQIWVHGKGPFVTGDKVFVGGGTARSPDPESVCQPKTSGKGSSSWAGSGINFQEETG